MMDTWAAELPPFHENMDHKLKQQKTNYFNSTSTTKAVPLKELCKELLSPTYQENKDITQMLQDLGVVAATRWVQELLDPKKATYPLMYESGAEYSWDGLSDNLMEALLGFMDVNDIADSSFAGVTSQIQVFGRIGMTSAADISNMASNGFLDRPTTNKEMSNKKTSLFHNLTEELQITAIICTVQEYTATRQSNTNDTDIHLNAKQERYKLLKQERLEKVTYEFIKCLIYRQMWDSDWCWKTANEVKK